MPTLANFRLNWLQDKVASAYLAVLTLEDAANQLLGEQTRSDILARVGAHAIVMATENRKLMLANGSPPRIDKTIRLDADWSPRRITDALVGLVRSGGTTRLIGPVPGVADTTVEVIFNEALLRADMLRWSRNVAGLSLIIALITSSLLYGTLQWLMVRPMRRITAGVLAFAANPEDATSGLQPTTRRDEIGEACTVLVAMQDDVRASLKQKEHLAALGSAVSKISHDLRGILSTTVLLSDRLALVDSPEVKRIAPRLVRAIDRAINLCTQTLTYARDEGPRLQRGRFRLNEVVDDVVADVEAIDGGGFAIVNEIGARFVVEADREQLYRVFANLAHNARAAGAHEVRVTAERIPQMIEINVADDGPGLPKAARENLFQPFTGSARQGGTGLGLVIARDVMRAHGGEISLAATSDTGTVFRLCLPQTE